MKNILFLTIALALVFTACTKEKVDTEKPAINIVAPEAGKMLMNGDQMHLEFQLSDNVELSKLQVTILKDGVEDFHDHKDINAKTFTYHEHYHIMVTDHTDFILKVEVEDKEGNMAEASRSYHIHP